MKSPLLLCIMDGYGIRKESYGNAIMRAKKPNIDKIFEENPFTTIEASGLAVGLPVGQMGNSEVGHTNIGAGRIVYQEFTRITKSIENGDFFKNDVLVSGIRNAVKYGKKIHIIGLLSDGGVHSHISHCFALIDMCKNLGADKVFVHPFLDGRDVSPTSGVGFLKDLQGKLNETGIGKIGTVSGRFYAMDRDNRWDREEKAYNALVNGVGDYYPDAAKHLKECYLNGITDEFTVPFVVSKDSNINSGDTVMFFNFRPDRARELTKSLTDSDFCSFPCPDRPRNVKFICFTQYDAEFDNVSVAFKPQILRNTLGEIISKSNKTQLRIAETEKYAHVTFFFNGGIEKRYKGEDRILVPSPKVKTYDLQPEMSAYEISKELFNQIDSGKYDIIVLNFANCDMVGHTGIFDAAVKAVETVDDCVGALYEKIKEVNGVMLITADHGNAEIMMDSDGAPFTAHTTQPVPFCVVNHQCKLREGGVLADIAPTILEILEIQQPKDMTGSSLLLN
jgi:2,3-bisphosphoglycerate-independent phosphoglycerate mutase